MAPRTSTPVARKADTVAHDLLSRVVSGDLEVGSLLPKEAELATHYRVNRTVIREAIKLLEVHRLVRPVRRLGTLVLDPVASISPEVLRAMITPAAGRVDRDTLRSFLEIRATLDVQMSMLAAERRTDADLRACEDRLGDVRAAVGNPDRYEAATEALALAIARASHNRLFEMLVYWHLEVSRDLGHLFRIVRPATEAHAQGLASFVELIRRRDVETVRNLVTAFHEWATPRLLASAALESGVPLDHVMENLR